MLNKRYKVCRDFTKLKYMFAQGISIGSVKALTSETERWFKPISEISAYLFIAVLTFGKARILVPIRNCH